MIGSCGTNKNFILANIMVVMSVFSSEIVLPSGQTRMSREFTVRAVAPCCDLSDRFSNRSELRTEKYKKFVERAKQGSVYRPPSLVVHHSDIFSAVRHGDRDATVRLIGEDESRVSARDEYGNTPFIIAVQNNRIDIAELLVSRGADVDARNLKGNTALHFSHKYKYEKLQKKLVNVWNANPAIRNTRWLLCAESMK